MPSKKFIQLFLIFFLSAVLCFSAGEDKIKPKKLLKKISEEILGKSLIRKDLLFEKGENLSPPIRSIFSPRKRRKSEAEFLPGEVQKKGEGVGSESGEKALVVMPHIRYIGYINSGHRTVALIIFEEEALAVEEGEMVSEEIRVGKVSPREIEIIGPDSRKWKYLLEGEEE